MPEARLERTRRSLPADYQYPRSTFYELPLERRLRRLLSGCDPELAELFFNLECAYAWKHLTSSTK